MCLQFVCDEHSADPVSSHYTGPWSRRPRPAYGTNLRAPDFAIRDCPALPSAHVTARAHLVDIFLPFDHTAPTYRHGRRDVATARAGSAAHLEENRDLAMFLIRGVSPSTFLPARLTHNSSE